MPYLYDVANAARLKGTQTTVMLYPNNLSSRVYPAVLRALKTGEVSGHGHTAQIAKALAARAGVRLFHDRDPSYISVRDLTADVANKLTALVHADYAESALANERGGSTYQEQYYTAAIKKLSSVDPMFSYRFNYRRYATQAKKLVAPSPIESMFAGAHTEAQRKALDEVVQQFMAGTPIPIAEFKG